MANKSKTDIKSAGIIGRYLVIMVFYDEVTCSHNYDELETDFHSPFCHSAMPFGQQRPSTDNRSNSTMSTVRVCVQWGSGTVYSGIIEHQL
jgi:hypothetical protein